MSKDKSNYSTIRNRVAKEYKDKIDELTAENKNLRSRLANHEEDLKAITDERDKLKKEILVMKVFGKFTDSDLRYIDLLSGDNSLLSSVLGKKGLIPSPLPTHMSTAKTSTIIEVLGKLI